MKSVRFNRLIKVLPIVFAILLLTSVILIVTACECAHEYTEEITKPATCSSTGEITYTCSNCGDFYNETIPMLEDHKLSTQYLSDGNGHWQECENCVYATEKVAHVYIYYTQGDLHWQQCEACGFTTDKVQHKFTIQGAITPSTCTTQGSSTKACVCGAADTETLPLVDHSYATYQKEGNLHWQKCENCDATTEKTEHVFTIQGTVAPSTCTELGSNTKICVCGETFTEVLPLAQHSYTKLMHNDNEHWFICANCDKENANQARTPHILTTQTTDPDCEKDGKAITTCNGCDYVKTETLLKLGHELDKSVFSKSSTGSVHYYKCAVCKNDVAEPHTLVDCDCPDGYNREATCYREGHQDQQCSICNWRNHFTPPMTNEHNWSAEWDSNDTFHWHICLTDDGACTAKGNETQHTWETKITAPTCEENGSERHVCSVCGAVQKSYNKIIKATGHDYETVDTLQTPTCTADGIALQCCKTCGKEAEATIKALGHTMSSYNMELTDVNNHYRMCSVCGFTNTTGKGHTWKDEVKKDASCTESGLTVHTCDYCKFTYEQVTTKNHSYVTVPDSYIDATCKDYGTHVGICAECGDAKTFVDDYLGYADHTVKEYPAKEMTETEPGNRHYWQCTVCGKYFTSKGCSEELTKEQVFTYPSQIVELENIAKLNEIAATMEDGAISNDYYLVSAVVDGVIEDTNTLMISDASETIWATLIDMENVETINDSDAIVLKGNILKYGDDVVLVNCKVISVDCGDDELYSLFFTVVENSPYISVYMYACDEMEEYYMPNTNNYNCLILGSKLTFSYFDNGGQKAVLQKVIINGKAYTAKNGEFEITVTEDVYAEFVFDHNNYCSVTLRDIDTSNNNGNAIVADEYISYTYTNGGYNSDGRLHKNSHLTFTANNANITGINITYETDWLEDNPAVLDNVVNAIKANGVTVSVEQGDANKNAKVVITLSASDGYTALEYFANACQARVVEITVLYQTNNTFATYQ